MASATNERVALCTRLAMAHNRLYRAYPVLVDGTYHMDMEMHGAREFEVIKLNEERVPVRVFAHMMAHYINHGCSHLHHPFKDHPVHRAMQWNSTPPGYEGGVRLVQPHSNATHTTSDTCTPQMCYCAAPAGRRHRLRPMVRPGGPQLRRLKGHNPPPPPPPAPPTPQSVQRSRARTNVQVDVGNDLDC